MITIVMIMATMKITNNIIYVSIVLEAPIPKKSLGDKTSLHVINVYIYIYIYSDRQQLSHNIAWPVTHMHTYMRACRPVILGIGASKVLPNNANSISD